MNASSLSLGFYDGDGTRSWALVGRGPNGWALVDAASEDPNEPIHQALQRLRERWPKGVSPRLGIELGLAHIQVIIGNRPDREIVAAERLDRDDPALLVRIERYGDDRIAVSIPLAALNAVVEPWRSLGIEPQDVEPLEIAWARAYPHMDALLYMPDLTRGRLLTFGERGFRTERLPDFTDGEKLEDWEITDRVVEYVRSARGSVKQLKSAILLGDSLVNVPDADGDLEDSEMFTVANHVSPEWADAFVLALAAAVGVAR
jgi:hypothetical protein